ncbi:hypothetical protein ACFVMC_30920 [Nocardia sp. NPDC127579]|uniref:hypothetical protein n=1 Tax=Nocardia sp. NPDC127579 TaxID=3345402 RepID=UPI003625E456
MRSAVALIGSLVLGGIGAAATALWVRLAYIVLSSRFSEDHPIDPHGYGLIFGSLMSVPVSAVAIVTLAYTVPRRYRARVTLVGTMILFLGNATLFVAWFSAA